MRAIESAAIASGQVSGAELMERAGRGVVEAMFAEWPALAAAPFRAAVLCGPGNNGGDGFVIARLLRAWGWEVEVFLHGTAERLPPDARANHDRWRAMGAVTPVGDAGRPSGEVAVFVDALFGTGLTRPLDPGVVAFAAACAAGGATRVVAVDILSGLCADSGRVIGPATVVPVADLTVSFHRPKLGHVLADGPGRSGALRIVDIGLGAGVAGAPGPVAMRAVAVPERLRKGGTGHKYVHGHALILGGPAGHGGAARLAARGALRIGAGLVTLGCPREARAENAARLDAVMLRVVETGPDLRAALEDPRLSAVALGPGLGVARAVGMLEVLLETGDGARPTVIDADALTALAGRDDLAGRLHPGCVLTPHGGEFARLFPDLAARLAAGAGSGPAYSKLDAVRAAARRAGCVVLLKGADTVIAAPDGRALVHAAAHGREAPWLATAGAGDVLAGFIAGLLARGLAPIEAAGHASWLHVECARAVGPGLIAEDLPEALPGVFRALGL